jgi:hypothetical protein
LLNPSMWFESMHPHSTIGDVGVFPTFKEKSLIG